MKKLIIFNILLSHIISFSLLAQDAGLPSMIYPVPNQRVHLMFDYPIEFVFKNYGSTTIAGNTLLTFTLLYDGIIQSPTYTSANHPKIDPGDSLIFNIPPVTFSTPNSTLELCIATSVQGDTNQANDTVCNMLRFSIDNNIDISPVDIDIVVPAIDSILTPGQNIFKIEGEIQNLGTVTLPKDYLIKAQLKIGSQIQNPTDRTNTALDTGSIFIMEMPGQLKAPEQEGPFTICVTLVDNNDDVNHSNDEYCGIFYVYDWTGLSNFQTGSVNSYSSGGDLFVENLDNTAATVMIYNATGQLQLQKNISIQNKKGGINISQLPKGIYILNLMQNHVVIHQNKFSID